MIFRLALAALVLSSLTSLAVGQTWLELTPAAGDAPSPRRYASAVHDPIGHRMIIFGGQGAGTLNDIWAFDLATNTWADLTPTAGAAPSDRRTPGSTYDSVGHRMITWSGQGSGGFNNDTWSFDLTSYLWSEHTPSAPIPNQRYGVAVVLDPIERELVTFAGFTNLGRFDDTWRFDPLADNWTDVSGATGPSMRCLHSASYDSRNHRMIMYGGQQSGPLDDIWALDLAQDTWSDLTPATRPAGRFFTAHVYDASNHRATIFGGTRGAAGGNTNEVWLFDLWTNTFVEMLPSGPLPSPREGAAGIYLQAEDRMVVFGGNDGSNLNEVWSLNDLSQTVTAAEPSPVPALFRLEQNQPNPFNPQTTIRYALSMAAHTALEVFDAAGRRVTTLLDEQRPAGVGEVTWDARDGRGERVASGLYFYRLRAGDREVTRKMLVVE